MYIWSCAREGMFRRNDDNLVPASAQSGYSVGGPDGAHGRIGRVVVGEKQYFHKALLSVSCAGENLWPP
jgi:hypothetical protein